MVHKYTWEFIPTISIPFVGYVLGDEEGYDVLRRLRAPGAE
jgi:hypothetical protein